MITLNNTIVSKNTTTYAWALFRNDGTMYGIYPSRRIAREARMNSGDYDNLSGARYVSVSITIVD